MTRKQYEQIQNALSQMQSLDQKAQAINTSIEEKSFDTQNNANTAPP